MDLRKKLKYFFVTPDCFDRTKVLRQLLPLFSTSLFVQICGRCVKFLDCTNGHLDMDSTVKCWSGSHMIVAVCSLFILLTSVPTSLFLSIDFLESKGKDINFTGPLNKREP